MNNRLRLVAAALGVAFVLAIALGASGVLTPKNQRTALGASTTLAIISGDVQVRHGTGDYTAAEDGMVLAPGDSVRTGAGARAVLTYFEGSTVEIEPLSELAIEVAHGNPDGSTVIEMRQQLGTTWHVVTRLVQGGSKYDVHTTASTASVRGTQFIVGVDAEQTTSVATTEGNVATSDAAATTTVAVTPGLITTTKKGEKPTPPQPAPEPERKVTVTVGDQNTIVVDMFGRANGISKDGKKIVQTPGAQVAIVDGKLVVTLPNLPDGDITTHFHNTSRTDDVEVTTKVEDKGKKSVEVTETVKPSETKVTGAEIKKSSSNGSSGESTVKLKKTTDTTEPKIGEILPTPTTEDQQKAADEQKNDEQKNKDTTSTTPGTTVNTGSSDAAKQAEAAAKEADAKAKEDAKKKEEEVKKQQAPAPGGFTPGTGIVPIVPNTGGNTTTGNTTSGGDKKGDKIIPAPIEIKLPKPGK